MGEDFRDDDLLLAALRRGDEAAFVWLLDTYGGALRRVARRYVQAPSVADDVVQDTWLGVIRGIDRFEGRSSLKTWIFQILMNVARTRGARESRAVPFSAADERRASTSELGFDPDRFRGPDDEWPGHWAQPPTPWQPADAFDQRDTLVRVHAAIAALPLNQRLVISLRDIEGWSSEEVCTMLEISANNQRVLLHRARAGVRSALDRHLQVVE